MALSRSAMCQRRTLSCNGLEAEIHGNPANAPCRTAKTRFGPSLSSISFAAAFTQLQGIFLEQTALNDAMSCPCRTIASRTDVPIIVDAQLVRLMIKLWFLSYFDNLFQQHCHMMFADQDVTRGDNIVVSHVWPWLRTRSAPSSDRAMLWHRILRSAVYHSHNDGVVLFHNQC